VHHRGWSARWPRTLAVRLDWWRATAETPIRILSVSRYDRPDPDSASLLHGPADAFGHGPAPVRGTVPNTCAGMFALSLASGFIGLRRREALLLCVVILHMVQGFATGDRHRSIPGGFVISKLATGVQCQSS